MVRSIRYCSFVVRADGRVLCQRTRHSDVAVAGHSDFRHQQRRHRVLGDGGGRDAGARRARAVVAGCRNLPHTWYYDQSLHNETDVTVELVERENFFDRRFTSRNTEKINIGKYDTVILHTRWCSGHPTFHYAQTRFKGRDNNGENIVLNGPWVRLFAPGTR